VVTRVIAHPDLGRCWVCGYDLAGLPGEGACPECRTGVFRFPVHQRERWSRSAGTTLGLGVLALVVTCVLGPFAIGLASTVIIRASETKRDLGLSGVWPRPVMGAQVGGVLGWAALVMGLMMTAFVLVMIGMVFVNGAQGSYG